MEKEDLDQVFNQGVSIDPDYYSTYSERLDMTMEKWGGSNDEMMAFARKWQSHQPWLMVQALEEQARNQTDGKDLEYYRYLASPKVWPEFNGAYQNYFKTYSMDDYPTWILYAWDVANANKLPDFLAFLRANGEKDEILRYFTPYLVNLVYAYRAQVIGWDHTGQLYLNTKEVWPEIAPVQAVGHRHVGQHLEVTDVAPVGEMRREQRLHYFRPRVPGRRRGPPGGARPPRRGCGGCARSGIATPRPGRPR